MKLSQQLSHSVPELLQALRQQVPLGAPFGTRLKLSAVVRTPQAEHQVAVAARIDAQGRRREQFWCDGLRVEEAAWLRLTCPEWECPHAVQVRAQWDAFHRRHDVAARPAAPGLLQLLTEVPISVGRQRFTARSARFPCFTPCPNGAHPPLTIDKSGFDLFDEQACLGGGVAEHEGVRRPRLPSVDAAKAYLLARHLESLAAVGAARDASRANRGPASDAD